MESEHGSDAVSAMSGTAVTEGQLPWRLGGGPGTFWHTAEVSSFIISRDAMESLGRFIKDRQCQGIAQPCILHTLLCFKENCCCFI